MSVSTIYTDFSKDIENYLNEKLPDLPPATAMEIGAHISNKLVILISDLWLEQVRQDKLEMARSRRRMFKKCDETEDADGGSK